MTEKKRDKQEIFIFKPCKTTAAYQGNLKKNISLDMNYAKNALEKQGYKIEISIKDLIIAKKEHTINVFKNCKILLKGVSEEKKARNIIENLYKKILK